MTLRWVPGWNGLTEPEAVSYVAAVEAADGEPLEYGVARAINDFVLGCKNDGIWSAIKASCILAGARTLNGALVPLVGAAPTNVNFVSGDYNRSTGLVGNGGKYLNSNRKSNQQPQNSLHLSGYLTSPRSANSALIAASKGVGQSYSSILVGGTWAFWSNGTDNSDTSTGIYSSSLSLNSTGLIASSRGSSTSFEVRGQGVNQTVARSSVAPSDLDLYVFARNYNGTADFTTTNFRLAFYSIGEALDLALLDTRVTRLMNLITYTQTAGLPDLSTMDLDAAAYIGGAYRAGGTLS
jgi:hypothetical protein